MSAGDWIDLGGLVVTVLGGGFALLAFLRDSRTKRTEWLSDLYKDFYESSSYKSMRRILDFSVQPELNQLKADIDKNLPTDLHDSFSDYLNFFELILRHCERGRLSIVEVNDLFQYYLSVLGRHDFIRTYARVNGYEALSAHLTKSAREIPA